MGIAAILVVSESEIATVKEDFDLQWAKDNPESLKELLKGLGFDISSDIELQEDLTHRNRFGAINTCARWVGNERIDKEWLNTGYASQEAKDKATGSKMLEDLYRRRGQVE